GERRINIHAAAATRDLRQVAQVEMTSVDNGERPVLAGSNFLSAGKDPASKGSASPLPTTPFHELVIECAGSVNAEAGAFIGNEPDVEHHGYSGSIGLDRHWNAGIRVKVEQLPVAVTLLLINRAQDHALAGSPVPAGEGGNHARLIRDRNGVIQYFAPLQAFQ